MEYKEFKPKANGLPKLQIAVTNIGSGVGIFRDFNGPLMELRSIDAAGGLLVSTDPDGQRIVVDGSVLKDDINHLHEKVAELSTKLAGHDRNLSSQTWDTTSLRSRLGQLEARPGFQLPESLYELAQMPKFHGSVPVIQNGRWAAINLSNDFFNKYEAKMDACIAVTGDVRRKHAEEIAAAKAHTRAEVAKLEAHILSRCTWLFVLAVVIICTTIAITNH